MQQQQVAEGQGPAPDAPCSPNWQGEAEGQLGGGCPAALQSSSPSPSPTAPQHLHLHPLPEPGGSIHGMEGAKGPHSKLPATVHSLRLLSSPDARYPWSMNGRAVGRIGRTFVHVLPEVPDVGKHVMELA
eukprot:scaffold34662_cov15-Tisochrysis_lutea.AAC.3